MAKERSVSPAERALEHEPPSTASAREQGRSELQTVLERPRIASSGPASDDAGPGARLQFGFESDGALVADVVRVGNASTPGRAFLTWKSPRGVEHSGWVPSVRGVGLRTGDRVLLTMPGNMLEPLVVAVIDGSSNRPPLPADERGHLTLRVGESLGIRGADGRALLEVVSSEQGAVLRLADPDLRLEVAGTLSLHAAEVDVRASERGVQIQANDDVEVKGERVRLN